MNGARKRRPLIRARAQKGLLWRLDKEIKVKCEHGILRNGALCPLCHPIHPTRVCRDGACDRDAEGRIHWRG